MRHFLARFLIGLAALALTLAACQNAPASQTVAPADSRSGARPLTIAWIPKALDNPVFEIGRSGAEQRAAELSAAGTAPVNVLYTASVASDAAEQVRVIDDVIGQEVDGIAVSCNDPTACMDPIGRAVEAGIPVMTWDADSPESRRFTYLGIDNVAAGRSAAELLVKAMGTSGKVAVLTGVPGAYNLEERIRGFRDGIAPYPGIEIVATVATNDDINLAVQMLEETMQAHPDLNGWFLAGMWPLVADRSSMPLWSDAALRKGMKTVAFDALPVELELLRDGYLSGLIDQKTWGWGYDSIKIMYDHLENGETFEPFTDSGFNIITQNNVDAMLHAWETNDFSDPLPAP